MCMCICMCTYAKQRSCAVRSPPRAHTSFRAHLADHQQGWLLGEGEGRVQGHRTHERLPGAAASRKPLMPNLSLQSALPCHSPPHLFLPFRVQSMRSLCGAFANFSESVPGDLAGDITQFEADAADEKYARASWRAVPPSAPGPFGRNAAIPRFRASDSELDCISNLPARLHV